MKNKEIEILKHMIEFYKKFCDGEEELNPIATGKEIKAIEKLLSYIEQLEKKVDQYENPEDLTLFYMWLDTSFSKCFFSSLKVAITSTLLSKLSFILL